MRLLDPPVPLGVTHGGVEVFVNRNDDKASERTHRVRGVYTGERWQCVELARRYLVVNMGVSFKDVDNACDIFRRAEEPGFFFAVRKNGLAVTARAFANVASSSPIRPSPRIADLVVWAPKGDFAGTGHVAVIVGLPPGGKHVQIAEQNAPKPRRWTAGHPYSRRLRLGADGRLSPAPGRNETLMGRIALSLT